MSISHESTSTKLLSVMQTYIFAASWLNCFLGCLIFETVSAFLGLSFRLKSNKHLLPKWHVRYCSWQMNKSRDQTPLVIFRHKYVENGFYPPLSVGVSPNSVHRPTDMSRELSTVTTAARARPHLDFTMSILPARKKKMICWGLHTNQLYNYSNPQPDLVLNQMMVIM